MVVVVVVDLADSPLQVGISYLPILASWVDSGPVEIDIIEVVAEQFYKGGQGRLRALARDHRLVLHTARLSLGTPGPFDRNELFWIAAAVDQANPLWLSEHLGFRRTAEVDLGFPNPLPLTRQSLDLMVQHAGELIEMFGRPLLIENIASPLRIGGTLSEPEFLNRLCEASGCGLLVDLTALAVNGRMHGFDPVRWLEEIDLNHIVQIRLGSHAQRIGLWRDTNDGPIADDVWVLADQVLSSAPVRAAILQRDAGFPPLGELARELRRIKASGRSSMVDAALPHAPPSAP